MHQGRSNYPKFQIHEKTLSTSEVVSGAGKLSGTRKRDQSLSAFCLRLRAGYAERAETIRLSSVSDPKKKIASVREATISPVIASSRYPSSPLDPHHKSRCSWGSVPSGPDHSSAARRGKVHRRRGAIYSIASLLVCLLQSAKFSLFTQPPSRPTKLQHNQFNCLTDERLLLDFGVLAQDPLWSVPCALPPNRAFQSARLSCWLSRLGCVDARDGERLCGNRPGFLSNPRALDSSERASER